ncbi:MAG: 2-C-methyl-D-erythritol 4-phosphate cytidylyltransferase [Bacteroidales bacterium]
MRSVVIVGGGTGSRMKSETPKQFLELHGKPVIIWTIEKFLEFDPDIKIILVLPESHLIVWHGLKVKFASTRKVVTATGGATRFHSVMKGLTNIYPGEIVGIHDAVRPLVSIDTLERCYSEAEKTGSAIPVIDTEDTLRTVIGMGSNILDRNIVKRVQTPQVFQAKKLLTAYENCLEQGYTDDASVFESYFGQINLVKGNVENIKITFPSDMKVAAALLAESD